MCLVYETALLHYNASTERHKPCSAHIYACRAFSRIGHFLAECPFCWRSCESHILKSYDLCSTLMITFVSSCKRYIYFFLTFIINEQLQFISVTYLWSRGVNEKGQCGLEPTDSALGPQAPHREPNVFPRNPMWGREPWVENRCNRTCKSFRKWFGGATLTQHMEQSEKQ